MIFRINIVRMNMNMRMIRIRIRIRNHHHHHRHHHHHHQKNQIDSAYHIPTLCYCFPILGEAPPPSSPTARLAQRRNQGLRCGSFWPGDLGRQETSDLPVVFIGGLLGSCKHYKHNSGKPTMVMIIVIIVVISLQNEFKN
jgi:hypothetical protein